MLEGNNIAVLKDQNGSNDVTLEVNPRTGEIADVVKLKMGDKTAVITINDLYNFVWVIANSEQQTSLTPVRKTEVMIYERQHKVRANKNIKKGDVLIVNCKIDVPLTVVDSLRDSQIAKKSLLTL